MFIRRVGSALALVLTLALASAALAANGPVDISGDVTTLPDPDTTVLDYGMVPLDANTTEIEGCAYVFKLNQPVPPDAEETIDAPAGFTGEITFSVTGTVEDGYTIQVSDTVSGYTAVVDEVYFGIGNNARRFTFDPSVTFAGPLPAPINPAGQPAQISHTFFCYDLEEDPQEELTVNKTADTSFTRTHLWDIDKWVETENEETVNGTPKIWLIGPGDEGDETATWTVEVTYLGYEDSDFNVSGMITIENTGGVDAVITSVDDVLAGEPIDVVCGVDFPYTLPMGERLICTYDQDVDGKIEGFNEVTVTTERDAYFANAEIIWGDPDPEINKTVTIKDISYLFGEVVLGTLDADDFDEGDVETFTYDEHFAWADYEDECGEAFTYDNTATIVETGQFAEATLLVNVLCEELTVDKTAETLFMREHFWDIDKWVETENGYELDGFPKIWLYTDGSGNETATWTVDVTYEGFGDSGFNVSGVITVTNTGDLDAEITGIVDELAGEAIALDCGEGFVLPYTLAVGETLVCSYDEDVDSAIEGFNEVTVTTERDEYLADAEIMWDDPDEEINETVNIKDISDLFGEQDLGTVTAPDGYQFTYTKGFAWEDYGADDCGSFQYDNTATIVETEQSASATLLVNVQCVVTDSAWAKGDDAICFIDEGFGNWGWTNPIVPGTYTWDLWAGAGQCDTSKGTLVGSVTVVYGDDGYVNVTYNLFEGYTLEETHVYVDYEMFPRLRNGRFTVAPGQYYNDSPFDGSEVYVIAHAVVGMPDPDFGP